MTNPATVAGRKIFLNISSFQILTMFRRGLFYSYLSIYLRFYLGLSVTETTLFASLPMIANVVFQNFVWGRVSDHFQIRRTLIIIGELLAAVITFIVWYVHTIPESHNAAGYVIIIGLTVVEIFWSMSNVAWTALLSDLYPEKERAGLLGRMQSMGAAGRFIGVWIGGLLYDGIPFRYEGWGFHEGWLFIIACGAMVLSTIPMLFVPEGGVAWAQKHRPEGNSDNPASGVDENAGVSKRFKIFLLAMVCIYFGLNAIVTLKSQYLSLDEGFDISSRTLSYIVNTTTVAIFISGLFIKRLSDKFKDENLLMVGLGAGVLYLIGYSLADRLVMIYVSEALCGVSLSMIMASSYAYASRLIPASKRGKQFAMYNASFFLSWGVPGTFIAGPLVDKLISSGMAQTGAYRLAFVASAVIMIIGAGILIYNTRMNNTNSHHE
jgi:MFS family permease